MPPINYPVKGPLVTPTGGGGGGNDTPWLRVPATRIFKELPCFGVKFSNTHPASESGFLPGIWGRGKSIAMQISFVMLIFLLLLNYFFGGRGQIA